MTAQRQLRSLAVRGLNLVYLTAATIRIDTGFCMADDGLHTVSELGSAATVDITASGINGLDTGAEASATWYSVWLVSGASGVGGLLSIDETSPTVPSGYDIQKRRIGWIYNDAGGDIRAFEYFCFGTTRYQYWDNEDETAQQVVSTGVAQTFATIDASVWIPPTARWAKLLVAAAAITTTGFARASVRPVGNAAADPCFVTTSYTRTTTNQRDMNTQSFWFYTGAGRNFQYVNSLTSGNQETDISVIGYADQLAEDLT